MYLLTPTALRLLKGPLSLDEVPALVHQVSLLVSVEGRLAGRQEHPLHGGGHTAALDEHLLRTPLLLEPSEGLIGPHLEGDIKTWTGSWTELGLTNPCPSETQMLRCHLSWRQTHAGKVRKGALNK